MRYVKELIETTLSTVNAFMTAKAYPCGKFLYKQCGYKSGNEIPEPDETWAEWTPRAQFSGFDTHVWVRGKFKAPDTIPDGTYLVLDCTRPSGSNPQTILYLNGASMQGLDPNHAVTWIEPGKEYDLALYIYFDGVSNGEAMIMPRMRAISELVEKTWFDMSVPFDAALCFDDNSYEKKTIFRHLEAACLMIDKANMGKPSFFASLAAADDYMEKEFYEKECGKGNLEVSVLAQTHIDVAWRWTVDQTKEKAQRSFGTVIRLMERYPDLIFMQSQPQLYQFVKDEAPQLYEEIKEKIAEGKWEPEGAMWLESDCNIPSGESFIRQLISGKKFYKDEFGKDTVTLWIPDVFGYSAALPQILRKSGVKNFVTGKISWSDVNDMPYDTFMWKGIDGSEIFTYFLTNKDFDIHSYFPEKTHEYVLFNGKMEPREIKSTYDVYRTKTWNDETLHTFGFGDGGGGPTYEMMEKYKRLSRGIPGIPKTKMTTLDSFLDRVHANFDENCKKLRETPRWDGELYLEYHRGTLTSIANVKKNNRKAEFALRKAEMLSVTSEKLLGGKYDKEAFDGMWKLMHLNQFHDIIPGSAIKEVYDRSEREYAEVLDGTDRISSDVLQKIASGVKSEGGWLVYNMNSASGNGLVQTEDGTLRTAAGVSPLGWSVKKELYADSHAGSAWNDTEKFIENGFFRIEFNSDGFMTSLYDKREDRELIRKGEVGNEIIAYEDYPYHWDAWELSHYTRLKPHSMDELVSAEPYRNGCAEGLTLKWRFMDSFITENIVVYDKIDRIDIFTEIDMKQMHLLLKALFPLDIRSTKTVAEIQYGHVERPNHMNTSWDEAKFETCMHKWVDISDNGYGVSLLNDSKYGFSSYDNKLAITLLKSTDGPYCGGDCHIHHFTYSVYPHKHNAALGGTVAQAYSVNAPMTAVELPANPAGTLPSDYSLVTCDCENIVTEVVKQAENGDGTIVRVYDAQNMASKPVLHFGFDVKEAYLVNLLEEEPQKLEVKDNSVRVPVGVFEIVTLLLK